MAGLISEQLTARFYEWELRGRGWHVFPYPVELEPIFFPFVGHISPVAGGVDDGKRPTVLSSLAGLFKNEKPKEKEENPFLEIPPVTACPVFDSEPLTVYSITLAKGEKLKPEDMEQLLLMLSYTRHPLSFEITATSTAIRTQFTCRESEAPHLYAQIQAYFPTAVITEFKEGLDILQDSLQTCIVDCAVTDEFMLPLRMADKIDRDPYIGLFAALEHLHADDYAVLQILFKGTQNPWAESIMRSVTDNKGGSFFSDAPEMVKHAQEKISAPLFAVIIRIAGQAVTSERAVAIATDVGRALIQQTQSATNGLSLLSQENYPFEDQMDDMFLRQSHRLGMLLNTRELATLVHLPSHEVTTPKVQRDTKKVKQAPDGTRGHTLVLGMNTYHGHDQLVTVPDSLRLRHTHIIGATGTGKSTLLLSMIAQDLKNGNGLAVLDPHGDLIEHILGYVPRERVEDVILIDPADGEYPIAFNILSAHSEVEKEILSSDLVAAFRRLSTSWGDQMNSVLANAILAFLESSKGGTLVDLRRFLIEKSFRDAHLKTVSDPHVIYYWQHEYPLLKSNSIGSILTRLDTFLRPKLIRNMVAQRKGLDFENILDTRKILLVKLSQGLIGAENSFLLGTFFVSKMYQAAMARQAKSAAERSNFFLYIDEFQNFITPSMSHILSGARKYHLGLILAHQDMQQLQKYDTELASSVVVNAGTRVCFRLGDVDARRFASGFSYFDAEDLENLHIGEAIARIEQPNLDFSLATIRLPEIDVYEAEVTSKLVLANSREKYGTRKELVEADLQHLAGVQFEHSTKGTLDTMPEPEAAERVPEPFTPVSMPTQREASRKAEQTRHRYLQTLIKKTAEARGYKASLEEVTPDGKGRVDVSLEKAGKRIACEISVTTNDEWEAHNVEKCIAAGYDGVIVCSSDLKNLQQIRELCQRRLQAEQYSNVHILTPEEAVQFFDAQVIQENKTGKTVKGYRIKVEFDGRPQEG